MREIENLKEAIIKNPDDFPRLSNDSKFKFRCHPGVPCFNQCCRDVNIFLTPYDVIRLKNHLGITSGELLAKYTISPFDKNLHFPVVLLKMTENEDKTCPFVTEKGCGVYEDRPWACRMYPLGLASPKEGMTGPLQKEFYFLMKEPVCKGFDEDHNYTVGDWLDDQGINEYNDMGQAFKDITLHPYFDKGGVLPPAKVEMFFTVCYNIDKFRDFVFNSTFLEKFEIDEETLKKIKGDDIELLNFGYQWLRFSLFGEKTIAVKEDTLDTKRAELRAKGKLPK